MTNSTPIVTHGATLHALTLPDFHVTETTHAPNARLERHAHSHAAITFVLRGAFVEDFGGGRALACRPMSMLFKPAGAVHSNRYSSHGAASFILECTSHADNVGKFASYAPQQGFTPLVPLMLDLHRAVRCDGVERSVVAEELALEVFEQLNAKRSLTDRNPPPWLAQVEERVRDGCRHSLRLSALAAEIGVHPVYLARVFRRHVGRSIGNHMIHCRLELALARLAQTDDPISQIALDTGFTDQPHLTRLFAREIRMTPARFRRLAGNRFRAFKT